MVGVLIIRGSTWGLRPVKIFCHSVLVQIWFVFSLVAQRTLKTSEVVISVRDARPFAVKVN